MFVRKPNPRSPYDNFALTVEVDNTVIARFAECSIPDASLNPELQKQNATGAIRNAPRKRRVVSFKRGMVDAGVFFAWRKLVNQGQPRLSRKTVIVTLTGANGKPICKWIITKAYPSRFSGGAPLDAKGNEVAMEELELTCESIEKTE